MTNPTSRSPAGNTTPLLREALQLAVTRLGILRDRMEGCDERHRAGEHSPFGHALSLEEIPEWIAEHEAILARARPTGEDHA